MAQARSCAIPHARLHAVETLSREDARCADAGRLRGPDRSDGVGPPVDRPCPTNRARRLRLRYLARYVFHVALTNARLQRFEHDRVTFCYTHARTQETRRLTLPIDAFI